MLNAGGIGMRQEKVSSVILMPASCLEIVPEESLKHNFSFKALDTMLSLICICFNDKR